MLLGISAFLFALLAFAFRRHMGPVHHSWRRRQARVIAGQLRGADRLQPPQFRYARLRAMDPLAFDELLMESLERCGHKVTRNHRSTGGEGVDGEVVIDGNVWLIRAKRYVDTMQPEHVAAFENLCCVSGHRGLFIHTGRTCPQSRAVITDGSVVQIIAGRALLALVTDGSLPMLASPTNQSLPEAVQGRLL